METLKQSAITAISQLPDTANLNKRIMNNEDKKIRSFLQSVVLNCNV